MENANVDLRPADSCVHNTFNRQHAVIATHIQLATTNLSQQAVVVLLIGRD